MRLAPAVALLLAVALPGCLHTELEVRARNQTQAPATVAVWINHTSEPSWHRVATVPPGGEVLLGVFDSPAHNDYSMLAIAGGLRAERTAQQLGPSYPSWTLEVQADQVRDVLLVY